MEKQETDMKQKLEMETGNRNVNKRRTNHWFFVVCLVITQVFYLAIVMGLAL